MSIMNLQGITRKYFDCRIESRSMIAVDGWTEYGTGPDKCWIEFSGDLPKFKDVKAKEADFEIWLKTRQDNARFNKPILEKIERLEENETHRRMAEAVIDEDGTGRKFILDNRAKIKTQRQLLRPV